MGLFSRLFGAAPVGASKPAPERISFWSTDAAEIAVRKGAVKSKDIVLRLIGMAPRATADNGAAMDDDSGFALKMRATAQNIPEVLAMWYASQTFIGHQMCAILSQHWLIDKACSVPARDAIRQGYDIVNTDGEDMDPKTLKALHKADREMRLMWNCEQFVRMGRIFGIRVATFLVDSTDADYYVKPFNPDGVEKDSYKGIVQVDPYWMAPELDQASSAHPDSDHFYEPTWWRINGIRYHRTHLIIFRNGDLPDLLKPAYLYGGVPVPQRIMERVYAAERVANEAPQLAQTKRTTVWQTDMGKFVALGEEGIARMAQWAEFRDNYAIKLGDKVDDEFGQFDTSLADLDNVIMTQYQIVAAAANMPSTKLLGTTPKGFSATGEYEEASYHEELESIQAHDLTPLVERHHLLSLRSMGIKDIETTVEWRPLDSPTAKEQAETNLVKAQTGAALVGSGALDSMDERQRVALDPASGYAGVDLSKAPEPPLDLDDDPDSE